MKKISKKVEVDTRKVDVAIKKIRRLKKLLKEANSLADELAYKNLLEVDIKF